MRSFHHIKTILDACLLTPKAGIPQKFFAVRISPARSAKDHSPALQGWGTGARNKTSPSRDERTPVARPRAFGGRRGDNMTPVTSSCPPILLLVRREKCPGVWGRSPQEHRKIRRRRAQFETQRKEARRPRNSEIRPDKHRVGPEWSECDDVPFVPISNS